MSNPHELSRGHKALLPLIRYALDEGWVVSRTPDGHLMFLKAGLPPIYTGLTAGIHRAPHTTQAHLLCRNVLADMARRPFREGNHG